MTVAFAWETLDEALADGAEDLLVAHWQEVALDKDVIPYAPDWERYRALERNAQFKAMTARLDGKIIGYDAFFLFPHHHYRHSLHAQNDILYVDPAHRGETGVRLVLEAERALFKVGVLKITYHTKLHVMLGQSNLPEDSLTNMETLLSIEEEYGVQLPDDALGGNDMTVGDLLRRLGYEHIEEVHAKVRRV